MSLTVSESNEVDQLSEIARNLAGGRQVWTNFIGDHKFILVVYDDFDKRTKLDSGDIVSDLYDRIIELKNKGYKVPLKRMK